MPDHPMTPMRAGELARAAGISKDALRYYEREKLIPPPRRSPNGYRMYPPEALRRVRVIRAALSIGFSVRELAGIVRRRDAGDAPCRDVRRLAGEKLRGLERQIADLAVWRSDLARVLRDWDRRLSETKDGKRAGLLEALADARGKLDGNRTPQRRLPASKATRSFPRLRGAPGDPPASG